MLRGPMHFELRRTPRQFATSLPRSNFFADYTLGSLREQVAGLQSSLCLVKREAQSLTYLSDTQLCEILVDLPFHGFHRCFVELLA